MLYELILYVGNGAWNYVQFQRGCGKPKQQIKLLCQKSPPPKGIVKRYDGLQINSVVGVIQYTRHPIVVEIKCCILGFVFNGRFQRCVKTALPSTETLMYTQPAGETGNKLIEAKNNGELKKDYLYVYQD